MCKVPPKVSGKKRKKTRSGSLKNNSFQQVSKMIVDYRTLLTEGVVREGREEPGIGVWEVKDKEGGRLWTMETKETGKENIQVQQAVHL